MTDTLINSDVPQEQQRETINPNQAMFDEGIKYLRGTGLQQDFGMAAAKLLDAADMKHEESYIFCALIYYCGIGVSRNIEIAADYANKYLDAQPRGDYAPLVDEIISGTIGTENARNILFSKSYKPTSGIFSRGIKWPLVAAIGLPVILLAAVGGYMFLGSDQSIDPNEVNQISLAKILTSDEIAQANKQAMSIAGGLFSEAQIAIQEKQRVEAENAKAQAEAEAAEKKRQQLEAEAQAKAEAEAKQRADAEANSRNQALAQQQLLLQQQQQARQQQYQQQQQARQQQYQQQQPTIPGQAQQAPGEPSSVGKALTGAAAAGAAFAIINGIMKKR